MQWDRRITTHLILCLGLLATFSAGVQAQQTTGPVTTTAAEAEAKITLDLRDVPLRLPDRADRRRDLLSAWQTALWAGAES